MVFLQIEMSHYQSAAVWGEEQPLAQCEVPLSSSSSRRQRLLFASARVPAAPVLGHSKAHSFAPRLPSHPVCLNLSVKLPLGFGGDFRSPDPENGAPGRTLEDLSTATVLFFLSSASETNLQIPLWSFRKRKKKKKNALKLLSKIEEDMPEF